MLSRTTAFAARRSFAARAFTSSTPSFGDQYDVVVVGEPKKMNQFLLVNVTQAYLGNHNVYRELPELTKHF